MKKGATLVEIMISVSLLAILVVGVNTYFISSLRSARKAATSSIVKSEGEQIQSNIVQTVKFARRIYLCTATSLSLLASDGTDITYSIVGTRLNENIVAPAPTPALTIVLNSANTSVTVTGCGGTAFSCTTAGKTVDMCFTLSSANAVDVTDTNSMTFKNYIYTSN